MEEALKVLKRVFGYDAFRGDQEKVIEATLAGKNSLVLMPTGMGKSLCFQLPAKMREGLTLVISPLIALMKDQVDAAVKKGFKAAYINSSLNREERVGAYRKLARGQFEILYVTPERFKKPEFLEALSQNQISLLAIDEAHCISEWGHDFRPDYTRIAEFRGKMNFPQTMALTATATPAVQKDIIKQCGFKLETDANSGSISSEVEVFDHGMQRSNLNVGVLELYGLDDKVRAFVAHRFTNPGATIVYFSLVDTLQKFSHEISRLGIEHVTYHGRMHPKDRKRFQNEFLASEEGLILATPAFGLGIDKENVRSVVHAEIPGSIEAYYQEIGRAGRDGEDSECVLYYDGDDVSIQMDFLKWANPDPGYIHAVYELIEGQPEKVKSEGVDFLRSHMNFYNRRDFRVDTALNLLERWEAIEKRREKGSKSSWYVALGAPDSEFLEQNLYEKRVKSQRNKLHAMVQYIENSECRLNQIYRYFGLNSEKECGRCDRCQAETSDAKKDS